MVRAGARIGDRVRIGTGAMVGKERAGGGRRPNPHRARVEEDATIGDGVRIHAGATIGREIRIGNGADVGTYARVDYGAEIHPGQRVGNNARVTTAGPAEKPGQQPAAAAAGKIEAARRAQRAEQEAPRASTR